MRLQSTPKTVALRLVVHMAEDLSTGHTSFIFHHSKNLFFGGKGNRNRRVLVCCRVIRLRKAFGGTRRFTRMQCMLKCVD